MNAPALSRYLTVSQWGMQSGMGRAVTLQDVAEKAGVSSKTVSRVVTGEGYVSDATRLLVNKAIAALNYRPNIAARSLVTARSYMLAIVSPHLHGHYYSELHAHAQQASRKAGYHMLVEEFAPRIGSVLELERSLQQMRIEGVILTAPVADDLRVLRMIERLELRCVRISPGFELDRTDSVSAGQQRAMIDLADHLLSLGHTRFGLIAAPEEMLGERRHEWLRDALIERGIALDSIRLERLDWTAPSPETARLAMTRFLAATPRPTAIFAFNDPIAVPMMQYALEQGLSIPGDLSIAGCDDGDIAQAMWPPLTTLQHPIAGMAQEAVQLLAKARPGTTRYLTLNMPLVIRGSTGPAPESC